MYTVSKQSILTNNYTRKAVSLEKIALKINKTKKYFKCIEGFLAFNIGFLIASIGFMIFFKYDRDMVFFVLYLVGTTGLNLYAYYYIKRELVRLTKNITKREEYDIG